MLYHVDHEHKTGLSHMDKHKEIRLDESEMNELASKYMSYAIGTAMKCGGEVAARNDRETLVSAANFGLFRALKTYDKNGGKPLRGWIGSSVSYAVRTDLYKLRKDGHECLGEMANHVAAEDQTEDREAQVRADTLFGIATRGLSRRDKALVRCVWIDGHGLYEAAPLMGLSYYATRSAVRRAKNRAQERLIPHVADYFRNN